MDVVQRTIEGKIICFAIANAHDYIQNYHVNGKFYERENLGVIQGLCRPDRVFVDVGANVGNHTIFVSKFCDVLRVIPFECNPEALPLLRENIRRNDCQNVETRYLGAALGAADGWARVKRAVDNNLGGTQFEYAPAGDDSFTVPVVTGDWVLIDEPVGVMKIDVELMEFDVLAGLKETIAKWRPALMVEIVPEKHAERDAWCEANGYRVEWGGWDNLLLPKEA